MSTAGTKGQPRPSIPALRAALLGFRRRIAKEPRCRHLELEGSKADLLDELMHQVMHLELELGFMGLHMERAGEVAEQDLAVLCQVVNGRFVRIKYTANRLLHLVQAERGGGS